MLVSSIARFNGVKNNSAVQAQPSQNSFHGTPQQATQSYGTLLINNIKSAINKINLLA